MSVPAARVRTSSGWRDIAIQGPQGIAGRTPSCKAFSTATALAWAAADTNGRIYGPAISSSFDDFGGSFTSNRWNCTRTGRYLVILSVSDYSANGNSLIGLIKNGATVIKRVQGTLTRGVDGSAPGLIVTVEDNFTAGDYLQIWGWHSGGGTSSASYEAIQLDAPAVSIPSNSPAYLTTAQFAALTPIDGMEVYLIVDATNGIIWHLRYNASSSSAYKWEYLGGGPFYAQVAANEATSSGTYAALATAGPSIALPLAGDYVIEHGCEVLSYPSGAFMYMSYDIGATGAVDGDGPVAHWISGQNVWDVISRSQRKNGLAASTLTAKYKVSAGPSNFANRWMRATPVRVG